MAAYEKRGQSRLSTHDAGMVALSASLDRVQQVEVFHRESPVAHGCVLVEVGVHCRVPSKRCLEFMGQKSGMGAYTEYSNP